MPDCNVSAHHCWMNVNVSTQHQCSMVYISLYMHGQHQCSVVYISLYMHGQHQCSMVYISLYVYAWTTSVQYGIHFIVRICMDNSAVWYTFHCKYMHGQLHCLVFPYTLQVHNRTTAVKQMKCCNKDVWCVLVCLVAQPLPQLF